MKWWHWPSFGPVEMADNPQQTQKNLRQPKGKLHFSFSQLSFETLLTICIAASMQKIQYLHRNLFEYWLIIVYWNSVVFHSIWMTKLGTHRRTVAELSPTGNAASLNSHFFFFRLNSFQLWGNEIDFADFWTTWTDGNPAVPSLDLHRSIEMMLGASQF